MRKNVTASVMRSINRSAVLNLIRDEGVISRSQIARELHMSLPTVMRIVDELMVDSLVREVGPGNSTGGRPSTLLAFNGSAFAVIGVDLGGMELYGTVSDMDGNIQYRLSIPHREMESIEGDDYLSKLVDFIQQLIDAPRPPGQSIRGIGVGVPGITIVPDGIVTWAPALGWRDLPLQEKLSDEFHMPVTVENDVNLAVLGEWGFGAGRRINSLVSIAVGTGIGAGILIDGAVYRGHHLAAGEIGYMLPSVDYLGKPRERFGALESISSSLGLVKRARQLLGPHDVDQIDSRYVFKSAQRGEQWATQAVEEMIDHLALAIANISAVLDPGAVIIGGGVADYAEMLIAPIRTKLEGVIPAVPRILASELGRDAVVMGAIMHVLHATETYLVVRQVA